MSDFIKRIRNGVEYYTIPLLNTKKVKTAFTTRYGGVSKGHLSSMNMSFTKGDAEENVRENYRRLAEAVGLDSEKYAFSYQVHADNVHVVDENNFKIGYKETDNLVRADALITDRKGVTLVKHSADCTVVYFYDPVNMAVGLAHSGWRSTVLDIVGKTIKKMTETYGTNPKDMLCAISPNIMECCFEVGSEVSNEFENAFDKQDNVVNYDYEKPHVNLVNAINVQLLKAGILTENIAKANLCSCCNSDEFFSHRKTKGQCGLSIGIISIVK